MATRRKWASAATEQFSDHLRQLPQRAFKWSELNQIIDQNRSEWRIPQSARANAFLRTLIDQGKLKEIRLDFPVRGELRYALGDVSIYGLLMSLNPRGYCSHYTAMMLHNLTEQSPATFYLNVEQTPKPRPQAGLDQGRIAAAFRRKPRISQNVALFGDRRICVLSGKHTGNLGVTTVAGPDGDDIRVTSVERTLIDITVRPYYAGGVYEILKAFRAAREIISINKLVAILHQLDYVYPYHQAIGFYLEKAGGYKESVIDLLRALPREYDFYLDYEMKSTSYSEPWRLHFPKGF